MNRVALVFVLSIGAVVARAGDNELSDSEKKDGWILLFDGKSMDGWVGKDGQAVNSDNVKDGAFNTFKNNGGYVPVYGRRKFSDFVLSLDFKISKDCNSGVFFRVTDPKDPVQSGFEIQILDSAGKTKVGTLSERHSRHGGALRRAGAVEERGQTRGGMAAYGDHGARQPDRSGGQR
jgi:hypothetical protein